MLDLQNVANYAPYVAPRGARIPLLPLIVALYHDADPGLVIGSRATVSNADFASDFNFSQHEMSAYFDDSPTHHLNARLVANPGWSATPLEPISLPIPPITVQTPVAHFAVAAVPQPATTGPLLPVLGGTATPPPTINSGFEAQQYVAAALQARGWDIHDVSRQQLGYDLYAQRGHQKRYVEVKSSLGLCTPTLTSREWQQARFHARDYLLAVIENFAPTEENVIYWVPNPSARCVATQQVTISLAIPRISWTAATVGIDAV